MAVTVPEKIPSAEARAGHLVHLGESVRNVGLAAGITFALVAAVEHVLMAHMHASLMVFACCSFGIASLGDGLMRHGTSRLWKLQYPRRGG
jgi:hypothetical protein